MNENYQLGTKGAGRPGSRVWARLCGDSAVGNRRMERASVYMDAPMLRGRAMASRPGPPRGGRPVGTAGVAPRAAASLATPAVPSSSAVCVK